MFAQTEVAQHILKRRYYAPGESTPRDVLDRVAAHVASAEIDDKKRSKLEAVFFDMMNQGKFLPNSPTLVNAGRDGGMFACFVLGMEDDLSSIAKTKGDAMAITKFGGGWGIGLSTLRPEGSKVLGSTHGVAGGPLGFLETFSGDMRVMTQGGFRDAACMATMECTHPDIKKFIRAKSIHNSIKRLLHLDAVYGAHVDDAAERLLRDPNMVSLAESYLSNFNMSVMVTDDFMETSELLGVSMDTVFDGEYGEQIVPRQLLREIATSAWENGEPGVLFIDNIRRKTRYDPDSINATNPCAEQPLPPNGSCCLGSINLSAFIDDSSGMIDYSALKYTVKMAVRFLDNVISVNKFPTDETREWSLTNRSVGLGVMGWADLLIEMGIMYDSEKAVGLASEVAKVIREAAEEASGELLEEKGGESWDGRRNRALLSIAPTGTISLLAGCSPGIEAIYSDTLIRMDGVGTHTIEHPLSKEEAFVTVRDIAPIWTVRHVAAWNEHVDTGISYTVNLPNDATVEQVEDIIRQAWFYRCNGVTVYRDGSRSRQVLNTQLGKGPSKGKRPQSLPGTTRKYTATIGKENSNVYVTTNTNEGRLWEVFLMHPRVQSLEELQLITVTTRLTSLLLRVGVDVEEIVQQLRKVEGISLFSIPAIIASALENETSGNGGECPDCESILIYHNGCNDCPNCGYSKCSQ